MVHGVSWLIILVICGADGNPFSLAFREGIELLSVGGADCNDDCS